MILNQLHWNLKKKKELKQKILESLNFWSCGCVPLLIYCIFAQKTFQEVVVDSFEDSYCEGGDFGVQG